MKILVLNGPNLNLLGRREPEIYGTLSLDALNRQIAAHGELLNEQRAGSDGKHMEQVELVFFQHNHEGVHIDTIQNACYAYDGVVYNPAAHTHYSIALRDAIAAIPTPFVEVHLSDINSREEFRKVSVMTDVCLAQFAGQGALSYEQAVDALVLWLDEHPEQRATARPGLNSSSPKRPKGFN
jgi:3-dehydroquinate dehydratase-2